MKQLTNDVITPLMHRSRDKSLHLPKNKKGRGSRHDSLLRLLACLRRAMTEEEFREFWMGLVNC